MDEGLVGDASGRTRVRSSVRNRSGWVNAAKCPASSISASPLVGRLDLLEVLLGQGGHGDHIALALEQEERDFNRMPSRQAS
jgi:hypothetical protein